MSKWINNKFIRFKDVIKPCHITSYCPYGQLVEEFPLRKKRNKFSCEVFGHDCPCFYHTELFAEKRWDMNKSISQKLINKQFIEFNKTLKKINNKEMK